MDDYDEFVQNRMQQNFRYPFEGMLILVHELHNLERKRDYSIERRRNTDIFVLIAQHVIRS